jgi:hypothetical protein
MALTLWSLEGLLSECFETAILRAFAGLDLDAPFAGFDLDAPFAGLDLDARWAAA